MLTRPSARPRMLRVAMSFRASVTSRSVTVSSWRHAEVVEEHLRIGLRPETAAADRGAIDLTAQALLPVDGRDELRGLDRGFQRVPRARRGLDAADGLDDRPLALDHLEEQHVVLERVRADAPVASVLADVVRDARGLIDTAGDRIEADREFPVALTLAVPDRERKESEGLHAVEEFCVAISVEALGLVGEVGGRRALPPARAVHHEALLAVRLSDVPVADEPLDRLRGSARLVVVERDGGGDERRRGERRGYP